MFVDCTSLFISEQLLFIIRFLEPVSVSKAAVLSPRVEKIPVSELEFNKTPSVYREIASDRTVESIPNLRM